MVPTVPSPLSACSSQEDTAGQPPRCEKPNTQLCTLTVLWLYSKGSKFYFITSQIFFLNNSLKTRPNLTDKLCIFSTTQREDKGNVNVRLNYERELDYTKTVIHKNEFSFHLSSTSS